MSANMDYQKIWEQKLLPPDFRTYEARLDYMQMTMQVDKAEYPYEAYLHEKKQAYERLLIDLNQHIYFTCYEVVKDHNDAKDLGQEVVTIFLSKLISLVEDIESPFGYAGRIAYTKALEWVRTQANRREIIKLMAPYATPFGNTWIRSGHELDTETIWQCIRQLSPLHQKLLTLSIEGYSHNEIGGELGISQSLVRKRLYYAKKVLREKLKLAGYVESAIGLFVHRQHLA